MVYGYLANSLMLKNDKKMLTPTSFYWNSVLKLSWINVIGVTSLPRSLFFYFLYESYTHYCVQNDQRLSDAEKVTTVGSSRETVDKLLLITNQ